MSVAVAQVPDAFPPPEQLRKAPYPAVDNVRWLAGPADVVEPLILDSSPWRAPAFLLEAIRPLTARG